MEEIFAASTYMPSAEGRENKSVLAPKPGHGLLVHTDVVNVSGGDGARGAEKVNHLCSLSPGKYVQVHLHLFNEITWIINFRKINITE